MVKLNALPNILTAVTKEKPYNAIITFSQDEGKFFVLRQLLDALLNHEKPLPKNCVEWKHIDELEIALTKALG